MLAINAAEFGSIGAFEISWFQGLSGGNTCWPSMKAPPPAVPTGGAGGLDAGGGVEVPGPEVGAGVGVGGVGVDGGVVTQ
jgi:hypothetical protein